MRVAAILLLVCSAIAQVVTPHPDPKDLFEFDSVRPKFSDHKIIQDESSFGRGGRRKVTTSLLIVLKRKFWDFSQPVVSKVLRRRPTAFQNVPAVPDQRPSSRSNIRPVFPSTKQSLLTGAGVSPELVQQPSQPKHLQLPCPLHPPSSHLSPLESLSQGLSAQSLRGFRWFNC